MIEFQKLNPPEPEFQKILLSAGHRGCGYSYSNLYMWGHQRCAMVGGYLTIFAQFGQRSIYPYPVGSGSIRPVLDAIMADAAQRGILCRFSAMSGEDCMELEELYPGRFRFYPDRDNCDYIYKTEDLAGLKGRKYQKKRNHLNKFRENHPDCQVAELNDDNLNAAREMVDTWYAERLAADPHADLHLEQRAIRRAFAHREELGLEGIVLTENGEVIALSMGSALSEDTFDVHFEKAREDIDGAYTAVNQAFAAHILKKYPQMIYLNREDDMGIPGLRKAKLSYQPDHMVVKFWAQLQEADEGDE